MDVEAVRTAIKNEIDLYGRLIELIVVRTEACGQQHRKTNCYYVRMQSGSNTNFVKYFLLHFDLQNNRLQLNVYVLNN